MIRTEIIPTSEEVSFNIPENYIGKVLEIIAFTKDEGENNHFPPVKKEPRFTVFHIDSDFKFNRDDANER